MADLTKEQQSVLQNSSKNLIVSASAGSGKTFVMIKYITQLLLEKHIPLRRMLILTFTRAAAGEMRERLNKSLLEQDQHDDFVLDQLDDLSISDISTIDAFCEKLIRRNIDKLDLDESFRLLENPDVIKNAAFENAIVQMGKLNPQMLDEIYYSFRKDKERIFYAISKLEDYFTFQPPGRCEFLLQNQELLFKKSSEFLNEKFKKDLAKTLSLLDESCPIFAFHEKYLAQCKALRGLLSFEICEDFAANVKQIATLELPQTPRVTGAEKDEELALNIKGLRAKCKAFVDEYKKFCFNDKILLQKQRTGSLCVAFLTLFKYYSQNYSEAKRRIDVLDFVDLENYALSLMQNDEILTDLQGKYDYIFVDEYQDTNRLQESIIKPLTAGGHFVAVGDPKQGIYGFRNATMEIMKEDIDNFSSSEDGSALYLTGNFRSDGRILNFVNKIFSVAMTQESVGIDYVKTSTLEGLLNYEKQAFPSVRVDFVTAEQESEVASPIGVYSVKKDELQTVDKDKMEVGTIVARIDDILTQKIYDASTKEFRNVEFDDIAILMRSRGSLMSALCEKLNQRGYPCYADVKDSATKEPEVQMLVELLKLLIDKDNDIALLSVMSSKLGGFSLDDLASMRLEHPNEKHFYDVYKLSLGKERVAEFDQMLNKVKVCAQVKGLNFALTQIFAQKDYFAYLKLEGLSEYVAVNNFLQDIKAYDFDIAGAIKFFSDIGGTKRNNLPSGHGIKLLTIHASKGLEYPIVILAGARKRLGKTNTSGLEICDELGPCFPAVNENSNTRCTTPNVEVAKLINKKKEMIDEIMIFYVAMTRAKNHLYIVGQFDEKDIYNPGEFDLVKAKNYLSIIAQCFAKELSDFGDTLTLGDWEFNKIDGVEDIVVAPETKARAKISEQTKAELNEYFDFKYPGEQYCQIGLKNTVTGLNAHNGQLPKAQVAESTETGNAYHAALKLLDFSRILDIQTFETEFEKIKNELGADYVNLIDHEILLKNILLIKKIVGRGKLYKEKQFVMSEKAGNLFGNDCQDEVLVQGVVDLFALGEQNVLIDYKYSGQTNPRVLLERYSKQLDLYSRAIEAGFGVKINKKYLLSLKNAEIIEYLS